MKTIMVLIFSSLFFTACTSNANSDQNKMYQDFAKRLNNGMAVGIDVRSNTEFKSNGSTLALNIPIKELPGRLPELDKDKTILVFCESGVRSFMAKKFLQIKGFKSVVNIVDWRAWNEIIKQTNAND